MADSRRQEARKVIERIMKKHGGLTPAIRAITPSDALEAIESLREIAARATTTLSKQLYSTDTRFIYELIQNAEDNTYDIATAKGHTPSLTFTMAQDTIVVDSNEDGFNKDNVQAICDTARSTKTATHGFIGEKGIGFKSVFKVASRVKVQSGDYCFAFDHGDDDHGLGMVTPINDDHETLPENVRTRFTLSLNGHSSSADRNAELDELPDTLLLFLTKLKKFVIRRRILLDNGEKVYEYGYDASQRLRTLHIGETRGFEWTTVSHSYYIERRVVQNLPADKARPHSNRAEVVLAFPVDKELIPVIEQQHVFAYLPMRKAGFHFQIQSDFITQASRQDLFDSAWNRALLAGVADTFLQAILRYRKGHPLEYTWMRYVPSLASISEPFWANLSELILTKLKSKELLQTRSRGELCTGSAMVWLPSDSVDTNDEPLFRDLLTVEEKDFPATTDLSAYKRELSRKEGPFYLSPQYASKDISSLMALGVRGLSDEDFCGFASQDLELKSSRLRSNLTNDDWHTRTAKKLSAIAKSDPAKVLNLKCIPLDDGTWVSGVCGRLYFPEFRGVPLPTDLGLRLLCKASLTNIARKELYSSLGVKHSGSKKTTTLILQRYNTTSINLTNSISHLRWLYHFLPQEERELDVRIPIFADDGIPTYRVYVTLGRHLRVGDLYFDTEDEYGVKKICQTQAKNMTGDIVTPNNINFVNAAYLDAVSPAVSAHDISWLEWLEHRACVRREPRLVKSNDPTKLSDLFSWIIEYVPEKVAAILQAYWFAYEDQMTQEIENVICDAEVLSKDSQVWTLEQTWLPTPDLVRISQEFGVFDCIPFLRLPIHLTVENQDEWEFLSLFGANHEPNPEFYLQILLIIKNSCEVPSSIPGHLIEIYEAIERNYNSSFHARVSDYFESHDLIYAPGPTSPVASVWTKPSLCLWNGPTPMTFLTVLGSFEEYKGNRSIESLFARVLQIPDTDYTHCIRELETSRNLPWLLDDFASTYRYTLSLVANDKDAQLQLRHSFESKKLVYVSSADQWHPPSSCIWTKSTNIAGKVAIASEYPLLKELFVDILQVQKPNKATYILELVTLCRDVPAPTIAQVRTLLWEINSWKPSGGDLDDLKALRCLPIRSSMGELQLQSMEDRFVIFDRQQHIDRFKGKVASMDVDMANLRLLQPLINAFDLDSRYTSRLTKEETRAQDAILKPSLTRDIRSRAYAFLRCAKHYQGSNAGKHTDDLYQRLRRADVLLSDQISSTLKLVLHGQTLGRQSTSGILHLEDDGTSIRLYVPKDAKLRERCYLTGVPERLVTHLGIEDPSGPKVLGDILKSSLLVLDDVLTDHGIIHVTGLTADQDSGAEAHTTTARSADTPTTETLVDDLSWVDSPREASSRDPTSPPSENPVHAHTTPEEPSLTGTGRAASAPTVNAEGYSRTEADQNDENYRALLDHLIGHAQGHTNVSYYLEGHVPNDAFGVRSNNQLLHDMKIGAAGELYAFEYLLRFLPSFSRANWRSTIRKYACVHEKYRDMTSYDGSETADIVYDDFQSALTRYLIRYQHLDATVWQGKTPKYYLEVKTTTSNCETRFFMSKGQVRRMERLAIPPQQSTAEVYVILRVSNLGRYDMCLEFIVDPETRRRDGKLRVEAESYNIFHSCECVPDEDEEDM